MRFLSIWSTNIVFYAQRSHVIFHVKHVIYTKCFTTQPIMIYYTPPPSRGHTMLHHGRTPSSCPLGVQCHQCVICELTSLAIIANVWRCVISKLTSLAIIANASHNSLSSIYLSIYYLSIYLSTYISIYLSLSLHTICCHFMPFRVSLGHPSWEFHDSVFNTPIFFRNNVEEFHPHETLSTTIKLLSSLSSLI
jgi:hypothetical protein